jgi:hypothetical protein
VAGKVYRIGYLGQGSKSRELADGGELPTLLQDLRALVPNAEVMLQRHRLAWAGDANAPTLTVWGVLVKRRTGPFLLLREYLAPPPDAVARDRIDVDAASAAVVDKEPC